MSALLSISYTDKVAASMGSSTSKTAKNIPKIVASQQPLPSARAPRPSSLTASQRAEPSSSQNHSATSQTASESKNADVMRDSQDPTLMKNLSALGQVQVPNFGIAFRTDSKMLDILKQRKEQELEAESLHQIRNRLGARSLSNLFDDCKQAGSKHEIQDLCELYQIDYDVLIELNRHVTAPSTSTIPLPARTVEEDDGETLLAIWVDAGADAKLKEPDRIA